MKVKVFKSVGEKAARAVKVYRDVWLSRINKTVSELVAMRHFYGKPHEGEAGLAIARFVKEAFRSIGIVRRVSKLSSTPLGKTYLSYILLNIVKKFDDSKVGVLFEDLKKIRNLNGLEFFEGIKNIIEKHFDGEVRKRIDRMMGLRVSSAIVGETGIYDPISERLITTDIVTGKPVIVKTKLKGEAMEELVFHGLKSKSRTIFIDYAEWKMLKVIDEGLSKGLKGKDLGRYVFARLRNEMKQDSYFFEALHYYLAAHLEKLRASEAASVAFGELLMHVNRMYRRMMAGIGRAIASIPIFGSIAEPLVSMYEGFGELGEGLSEVVKRAKKEGSTRTIKVDLNRKDMLFDFF